jgi:hypothetical protein
MADRNTRRGRRLERRDLRENRGRVTERVDRDRPARRVETRTQRPEHREVERTTTRTRYNERERDRRRGGTPWWVWLLGLAALGLIAFMIFQGLNDDDASSTGGAASGTTSQGAGTEVGTSGTVVADGTDLLATSADADTLGGYEGSRVEATDVTVESVTGDETFWVGESSDERLFVFLDLAGESGPDIDAGDQVNFSGTVEPLPVDFESRFDVSADEGADQLEEQGRYLEVTDITQR